MKALPKSRLKQIEEITKKTLDECLTTLPKLVRDTVEKRTSAICAAAMGFSVDSWGDRWEFRTSDRSNSILMDLVIKMMRPAVEEVMTKVLEDANKLFGTKAQFDKAKAEYIRQYKSYLESHLSEKIRKEARSNGEAEADVMFRAIVEKAMVEIVVETETIDKQEEALKGRKKKNGTPEPMPTPPEPPPEPSWADGTLEELRKKVFPQASVEDGDDNT